MGIRTKKSVWSVILLFVLIALSACGGGTPAPTPIASPSPALTPTPTPTPAVTPSAPAPTQQQTLPPPSIQWDFKADVYYPLVVADDQIYVTEREALYALAASSGELKWQFKASGYSDLRSAPTVADDTVYISANVDTGDYPLYALDAGTGAVKWKFQARAAIPSPVVVAGVVYGSTQGTVYALDGVSGALKWKASTGGYSSDLLGVIEQLAFVGTTGGNNVDTVHVLDAASGQEKWAIDEVDTWAVDSAVVVYANYKDYPYPRWDEFYVHGLDPASGRQEWEFTVRTNNRHYGLTIADGVVYFTAGDDVVYALDRTGSKLWTSTVRDPGIWQVEGGVVSVAEGTDTPSIFLDAKTGALLWTIEDKYPESRFLGLSSSVGFLQQDEWLYAVDAKSGLLRWKFPLGRDEIAVPPLSEGGVAYLVSERGNVYCLTEVSIAWGKRVSAEFKARVIEIAERLGADVDHLMAVMAFETGRSFDPAVTNPVSGAVGLIQFLPSTARSLGTTVEELRGMSAVEQLDYVEKYFLPYRGRLTTLEDVYMAVLWPKAIGQPNEYALFVTPSIEYGQNRGLDLDADGKVTKAEASAKVQDSLAEGLGSQNKG